MYHYVIVATSNRAFTSVHYKDENEKEFKHSTGFSNEEQARDAAKKRALLEGLKEGEYRAVILPESILVS